MDIAIRQNVMGPLRMLQLAGECTSLQAFVQVSTVRVNCDKKGKIEERLYSDAGRDWVALYKKILTMDPRDLRANQEDILGLFPNAFCFSKCLAEHLLVAMGDRGIPMILLRPSILGASAVEPTPGWTDKLGLL